MTATAATSEAPEVAASEASKPIPHAADQKGSTSMAQTTECIHCTVPTEGEAVCTFCANYTPPAGMAVIATPGRFEASCPCGSSLIIDGDSDEDDTMIDEWHEAHERCQPVDLDGQELTAAADRFAALVNEREIIHGGDVEKVIPFPRPDWSDPEQDHIGHSAEGSYYGSAPVWVNASTVTGRNDPDDGVLTPASARTAVTQYGDGHVLVSLSLRKWWAPTDANTGPRWAGTVLDFTPAEAAQLAHALMAASDLATAQLAEAAH